MRGRPRKPAKFKVLDGNPGQRPIEFGPKWKDGFGSCPKHIQAEGRKLWRQLSRELDEKGISAKVFRPMLEGLCYWYGEWRRLIEEVRKQDTFKIEQSGYEGPRPQVSMSHKAFNNYRYACQEFGLTPASNGKVTVPQSKKESLRNKLMANAK